MSIHQYTHCTYTESEPKQISCRRKNLHKPRAKFLLMETQLLRWCFYTLLRLLSQQNWHLQSSPTRLRLDPALDVHVSPPRELRPGHTLGRDHLWLPHEVHTLMLPVWQVLSVQQSPFVTEDLIFSGTSGVLAVIPIKFYPFYRLFSLHYTMNKWWHFSFSM